MPAMKRFGLSRPTRCPINPPSLLSHEPPPGTPVRKRPPRGILYHRYDIDEQGLIRDAQIVPPTSQNQKTIEDDLRVFVPPRLALTQDALTWQCEQAVRNYDPCISCSTHFLTLHLEREG